MKPIGLRPLILCPVLGILTACTTSGPVPSTVPPTATVLMQPTSQMRASDRMLYWLEEARELQTMATHREREAELVWRKYPGPEMGQFVQHMRLLAHQLQGAAEYANAQAQEALREIPPDILQQLHSALDDSVRADIKEIDATPAIRRTAHGIAAAQ